MSNAKHKFQGDIAKSRLAGGWERNARLYLPLPMTPKAAPLVNDVTRKFKCIRTLLVGNARCLSNLREPSGTQKPL